MTLIELKSSSDVQEFMTKNSNVVVTFSAHWCGPCRASKPALEELARKYSNDYSKDVKIGIVYEDDLGDTIHQYNVRAFPTYVLYQNNGKEMNRIEGANIPGVEQMIENAPHSIKQTFTGGETLGGGSNVASAEDARLARLAKLGGVGSSAGITATTEPSPTIKAEVQSIATDESSKEAKEEEDGQAMDIEKPEEETVEEDPTTHLNQEYIEALTNEMGFTLLRAQKGLLYGIGNTLEGAIEWLTEHQDDDDIDEPIKPKSSMVAQSYKCNECGKILSNMANLELHANKTGHSDFEESTQSVTPLTAEEKAAKIQEIKELLKLKRVERETIEEKESIDREKQRRFMGKEIAKTKEQLEIEQRKREAYLRKKEKEDFLKERQRLRQQLAQDKAERAAHSGKLSSKLSVEGYKPDMLQYGNDGTAPPASDSANDDSKPAKKVKNVDSTKIQEYINKVSSYKAGGDGGKCLKILKIYISNVIDNPNENKFKSINMDNNAYKTKVKPFIGAKQLLMAVGFQQIDPSTLSISDDTYNLQLLTETRTKLEAALVAYG